LARFWKKPRVEAGTDLDRRGKGADLERMEKRKKLMK